WSASSRSTSPTRSNSPRPSGSHASGTASSPRQSWGRWDRCSDGSAASHRKVPTGLHPGTMARSTTRRRTEQVHDSPTLGAPRLEVTGHVVVGEAGLADGPSQVLGDVVVAEGDGVGVAQD